MPDPQDSADELMCGENLAKVQETLNKLKLSLYVCKHLLLSLNLGDKS